MLHSTSTNVIPAPAHRWVFAYGSLMWRPDFPYKERHPALLQGWHRQLCLLSTHYRGTTEKPGLVLGLVEGKLCQGIAFAVHNECWEEVKTILYQREMRHNLYEPKELEVHLCPEKCVNHLGEKIQALTFVARPEHPHFWQGTEAQTLSYIRQGQGSMGSASDYLLSTCAYLRQESICDQALEEIAKKL